MTEQQVADLLDRVTSTLPPAGPDLVPGAVDRGQRRRRHHLLGTAAATVAVLGLAGTGLTVALSGENAHPSRGVDVAEGPTSPQQPAPAPVAPGAVAQWDLAVTAEQVPATFGSLVPGAVTGVPNKEMDDAGPIVDFRWNGYAVRVGLVADDHASGQRVTDPLVRCQQQGSAGLSCAPGQVPGSYEQTMTWTGPAVDGGVTTRILTVYFAEGWDVTISESNAADSKDSALLSPDVPLTLDQLRTVAYSDVWFD